MRILLTGAGGFLGGVVLNRALAMPGASVMALRIAQDRAKLSSSIVEFHAKTPWTVAELSTNLSDSCPTHIIHIGALSSPEACEKDPTAAEVFNIQCTKALTEYAGHIGAHVTFVSTDLVFDGMQSVGRRFSQEDLPSPNSVYARTKRAAEMNVLESGRGSVVRAALIYGYSPSLAKGVLGWMERAFKNRTPLKLFYDEYRTPIHAQDLSALLLMVSRLKLLGLWHCGGPERLSRVEFGEQVAESLGYDKSLIVPTSRQDPTIVPARPEDVSLDSAALIRATGITPLTVSAALAAYPEWR
jgi:dTDP-4-dehydrorhamnose reductase